MPINPLISNKIKNDEIPDKIKQILSEILNAENEMQNHGSKSDYKINIAKILEKYADDQYVKNFCDTYE